MHFHLPKPLHGWREFAGEVGIIVIGVLIALGAEQLVETAHWRHQVEAFRSVVHRELADNLGTYEYRIKENGCVKRRLDELDAWLVIRGWIKRPPSTHRGHEPLRPLAWLRLRFRAGFERGELFLDRVVALHRRDVGHRARSFGRLGDRAALGHRA